MRPYPKYPFVMPDDLAHRVLWDKRDIRNRVKVNIRVWAGELDRSYDSAADIVQRLAAQKRIHLVRRGQHRVATYRITDPDTYDPDAPEPEPEPERSQRWG